eukprot:scaffold55515_cov26-Tisochrysis_lutea.AAC.2
MAASLRSAAESLRSVEARNSSAAEHCSFSAAIWCAAERCCASANASFRFSSARASSNSETLSSTPTDPLVLASAALASPRSCTLLSHNAFNSRRAVACSRTLACAESRSSCDTRSALRRRSASASSMVTCSRSCADVAVWRADSARRASRSSSAARRFSRSAAAESRSASKSERCLASSRRLSSRSLSTRARVDRS